MSLVRLRGIKKVRKRLANGATVEIHYAYVRGPVIWRTDSAYGVGSPEYLAAYNRAHGLDHAAPARTSGLFREVLVRFLASAEFRALSASYQKDLRWAVARLDEKFGAAPAALFDRPEVRKRIRDWRAQFKPRDADRARQGLTKIVKWAIEEDLLTANHVSGLKNAYAADRHHLIWVDDEIDATVAAATPEIAAAVTLWAETGMRPGDLCRATDAQTAGATLRVRTSKRGRWAVIPLTDRASAVITARPAGQKYLLKPPRADCWTPGHLSRSIKAAARLAGVREELHPYDLRGSAVTRLVLAGVNIPDLALIMGWKVETAAKMLDIYAQLDPRRAESVRARLANQRAAGLRLVVG